MCPPERFIAEYLTFLQTTIALCLFVSYDINDQIYWVILGFPSGLDGKESACNVETWVWSLGWEKSPGEGNDYPL